MRRVFLKLSGEALAGEKHMGFDEPTVAEVARQVKQIVQGIPYGSPQDEEDVCVPLPAGGMACGVRDGISARTIGTVQDGDAASGERGGIQVGIVIGGGNFWRGRTSGSIDRTKADQIGMLATVMNCIYVSEVFRSAGMMTQILTPFECGNMTKLFSKDRANKYFEKGMVVFFAGGTGHPYFSTDTGTVLRAVEMEADGIYLAKAVDGVYDSDPKVNPAAVKYDEISIEEVISRKLAVVDLTASILCMENKMPMYVFGLNEKDSIVKAVTGEFCGTKVTVG